MVQIRSPNLANVAANVERVRSARLQNQAAGMSLDQMRRRDQNLERIRQMRTQFQNAGQIVQELRTQGHHDAADTFVQMQRQMKQGAIQQIQLYGQNVTDESSYEALRGYLLNQGLIEEDDLPVSFDKAIFPRLMKQQEVELKKFDLEVGVKEGVTQQQQVLMDQFGQVRHRGPVRGALGERRLRETRRGRQQAAEQFQQRETRLGAEKKGTDSRLMGDRVAGFYGGIFDSTNNDFQIPEQPNRVKAIRVMAQAERYRQQGIPPLQAVEKALVDEEGQEGMGLGPGAQGPPAPAGGGASGLPQRFDPTGFLRRHQRR